MSRKGQKVICQNIKTGEVKHFDSITECGKYFNKLRQNIYQKIINGIPTKTGWVFDYEG